MTYTGWRKLLSMLFVAFCAAFHSLACTVAIPVVLLWYMRLRWEE